MSQIKKVEKNVFWEKRIDINQPAGTEELTAEMELLAEAEGELYLQATLFSDQNQILAKNGTGFYVTNADLAVTFELDKECYKPGEIINVKTIVTNRGTEFIENALLSIKKGDLTISDHTVSLAPGETLELSLAELSAQYSFILNAQINDLRYAKYIQIEKPKVELILNTPDIVGREPFNAQLLLTNVTSVATSFTLDFDGEISQITLNPEETRTIIKTMEISSDYQLKATLSGEVSNSVQKFIQFGESVEILLSPSVVYREGEIEIPYSVKNTGQLPSYVDINFQLGDGEKIVRTVYLNPNQEITDQLYYNLDAGEYALHYESYFGSDF